MTINHPDDAETLRDIPGDWQETWAEGEGTAMYTLPDGEHAVVWQETANSYKCIGRGSLSLESGPLEWYELDQIRGEEFTAAECDALEDTVETMSVDKIAPYTFPRAESKKPGECLELDHDFIAVEYDESEVFDRLHQALPVSSSLGRDDLENIISQVHSRFLISARLEFE